MNKLKLSSRQNLGKVKLINRAAIAAMQKKTIRSGEVFKENFTDIFQTDLEQVAFSLESDKKPFLEDNKAIKRCKTISSCVQRFAGDSVVGRTFGLCLTAKLCKKRVWGKAPYKSSICKSFAHHKSSYKSFCQTKLCTGTCIQSKAYTSTNLGGKACTKLRLTKRFVRRFVWGLGFKAEPHRSPIKALKQEQEKRLAQSPVQVQNKAYTSTYQRFVRRFVMSEALTNRRFVRGLGFGFWGEAPQEPHRSPIKAPKQEDLVGFGFWVLGFGAKPHRSPIGASQEPHQSPKLYGLQIKDLYAKLCSGSKPQSTQERQRKAPVSKLLMHAHKQTNKKKRSFWRKPSAQLSLNIKIGDYLSSGDKIGEIKESETLKKTRKSIILTSSGRVVTISKTGLTLQKTQPILFYNSARLHVQKGEWVKEGSPILTLTHQTLITGDIVQGIPRIEQLFEAFTSQTSTATSLSKNEDKRSSIRFKSVHDTLHSQVRDIFRKHWLESVLPIAVRKSLEEIGYILVEMIQKVYLSQGVLIADKHIEIIIRGLASKGQILDSGTTGLFLEEVLPIRQIENANLTTPGKKCLYVPAVMGLTATALNSDSFISAASFQETTRVLSRDAVFGKSDFLRGLKEKVVIGDLISAGTGLDTYFIYTTIVTS